MECSIKSCCDGTVELILNATPSDAEERRFLKKVAYGEVVIKQVKGLQPGYSPDELLKAVIIFGSVSI